MKSECRGYTFYITVFCLLLAVTVSLAGCANPAKAKQDHVARGEEYLKDSKFQEASLEFRNALQIDDKLAAAHWGLARAFEGLERFPEMLDELRKTGVTIVLVEQNARAALAVADYGYVLEMGQLGLHGPAAALATDARVIDTYLGAARQRA